MQAHAQLYFFITLAHFSCFPEMSIHRVFIISCLPFIAHHNHKEGLLTSKKAKRRACAHPRSTKAWGRFTGTDAPAPLQAPLQAAAAAAVVVLLLLLLLALLACPATPVASLPSSGLSRPLPLPAPLPRRNLPSASSRGTKAGSTAATGPRPTRWLAASTPPRPWSGSRPASRLSPSPTSSSPPASCPPS